MRGYHSLQSCYLLLLLFASSNVPCGQARTSRTPNPPSRKHGNDNGQNFFKFITRPDVQAPKWDITIHDESALSPGYWFLSPYADLHQKQRGQPWVGPYIYDGRGQLVWSGVPLFDRFNVFDFTVSRIAGTDMLTAIYKRETAGVILDSSYQIQKVVEWPGVYNNSNMHDFIVSEDGTRALVFTKYPQKLSAETRKGVQEDCSIIMNGVQELDITESKPKTLFAWNATDRIGLDESSYSKVAGSDSVCPHKQDVYHFNSIDRFPNGDFLVSSRHMDTIYRISHQNGSIVWRLGGIKSDFEFTGNAKFSRQHHARIQEHNETHTLISLMDNAMGTDRQLPSHSYSRGLILSLHGQSADAVAEYAHPRLEYTNARGSVQILSNGNAFIGWSTQSLQSEHASDGRLLMQARLKEAHKTYRSFKFAWTGRPNQPPDLVSGAEKGKTKFFVSWNGATEVATWRIYETDTHGHNETLVTSRNQTSFETTLMCHRFVEYVIAEAVDLDGNPLGRSRVVKTSPPDRKGEGWVEEQHWLQDHIAPESDAESPTVSGEVYSTTESWPAEISSALKTPLAAYICGIVTCATAFVVVWAAWRYKCVSFRRATGVKGPEYEPLVKNKQALELDEEGEIDQKYVEFPEEGTDGSVWKYYARSLK